MGMNYELFIGAFAVAMFFYGAMTQADRRAKAGLESAVFARTRAGLGLQVLTMLGQLGWLALVAIGFMSIKWYWVIGIFLLAGSAGGIIYTLYAVRSGQHGGVLHNFVSGLAGLFVAGAAIYLWAERLGWL